MDNGVQVWVKCSACHKAEFTSKTACSRCGQDFAKTDYADNKPTLPKPESMEKENPIKKEISCYRCRSLWIGVAIAGFSLLTILNFMYSLFDFAIYQTYDIIRYTSSFIVAGFFSYVVYRLLDDFCKGGELVDKGSKWGLTFGLGLAVGVIMLLVITFVALDISSFFYSNYAEFDWEYHGSMTVTDRETVNERFLSESNNCIYIKDLIDQDYNDRLSVDYFGDHIFTIGEYDELNKKYVECWKR